MPFFRVWAVRPMETAGETWVRPPPMAACRRQEAKVAAAGMPAPEEGVVEVATPKPQAAADPGLSV